MKLHFYPNNLHKSSMRNSNTIKLFRHCFAVLLIIASFSRANAQGWINDPHFYTGSGANSSSGVQKMLVLSDNRILIFGSFSTFNDTVCNRLVCLKPNGGIDTNFHSGSGFSSYVYSMLEQPDGKIILAGSFNSYNDTVRPTIIRIYPNGVIDHTFDAGSDNFNNVSSSKLQPDGKILLAGSFTTFHGITANGIVRLNPDGSVDNTFNTGTGAGAGNSLAVHVLQPDGKIILGGNDLTYNNTAVGNIFRINSDGSLDNTFNNVYINQIGAIVFRQSDGTYYLIGRFNSVNDQPMNHVALLDQNGQLNPAFNSPIGFNNVDLLRGYIQADDKIIIYGNFTSYNGNVRNRILRLNPDGSLDTTFDLSDGADNWIQAVDEQSPDRLLVAGKFDYFKNETKNDITRIINCSPFVQDNYVTACETYFWAENNDTYIISGLYSKVFVMSNGCDSIVNLHLTITHTSPVSVNMYVQPSDVNDCVGVLAIHTTGNADFTSNIDGESSFTHSGHKVVGNLCAGVHSLITTDVCGSSITSTFVIPVDSNYVFNNPFIDSIAVDSLGNTLTDCFIYYNSIDTAFIASILATGNTLTVVWNIVDAHGSNFDTTTYVLNNGNGVYYLQLSVFCPNKALGEYFSVSQAIYFENGSVATAGLNDQTLMSFNIFPNPTSGNITISSEIQSARLKVLDIQGKLIFTEDIYQNASISLAHLKAGVYFFHLSSDKGSVMQRVVKY